MITEKQKQIQPLFALCLLTLLAGLCLWTTPTFAQSAPRTVALTITKDDDSVLSSRFAYELREQLIKSSSLKEADLSTAQITVRAVILEVKKTNGQSDDLLTYSIAFTAKIKEFDHYLTSKVGFCGAQVLERCARDIMAATLDTKIWVPNDYLLPENKKKR